MSTVRAVISSALMRGIVDFPSVVSEYVTMIWEEKGLTLEAGDDAKVSLIVGFMPPACFDTYEVDISYNKSQPFDYQPIRITLEISTLRNLLTLAGPSDLVEISIDNTLGASWSKRVVIKLGALQATLLAEEDLPPQKTPELDYKSSATIEAKKFSWALRAVIAVETNGSFDISLDSKEMRVKIPRKLGDGVNVCFESGELSKLNAPRPITATYLSRWVEPMVRTIANGSTQDIRVQFELNYPLRLDWHCNYGGQLKRPLSDNAQWVYFMAPRFRKVEIDDL